MRTLLAGVFLLFAFFSTTFTELAEKLHIFIIDPAALKPKIENLATSALKEFIR